MRKVLFFVTLLMSISAHAEILTGNCGKDGDNLTYTLDTETGVLKIEGSGDMKDYNYYSSAARSPWAWNSYVKSVEIGNSVTSIGDCAFYECPALIRANIGHSISSIGDYAFYGCMSLTNIEIPNSVSSIGDYTFDGCSNLPIENGIRYAGNYIVEAINKDITSVQIKDDTRFIGGSAFRDCSNLVSVTLPNSMISIGDAAFSGCRKIDCILISDVSAWCNISGLSNLMDYGASSKALYVNNVQITDIVIHEGPTSIPDYCFSFFKNITSISIPNSVTSIGHNAFKGYSGLINITIGNSVISIGTSAFYGCSSLTNIEIPNSVTSIGYYAFWGCYELNNVVIPNFVTDIGYRAFWGCRLATVISKASTPPNILFLNDHLEYAFSEQTFMHATVIVPEDTFLDYVYSSDWWHFAHIKEMATSVNQLDDSNVYLLADGNGCNYTVYDSLEGRLVNKKYIHSLNEQDTGSCWLVKNVAGGKTLYNIGAKMYATIDVNGQMNLSPNPVILNIFDNENGITLNGYNKLFVLCTDIDVTGIEPLEIGVSKDTRIYSIDGQIQKEAEKGINIIKLSDGTTKKVIVK